MTFNCVQQTSINTLVILTMFAKGQQCTVQDISLFSTQFHFISFHLLYMKPTEYNYHNSQKS